MKIIIWLSIMALAACGGDADRPENLDRLKGLGSVVLPLVNVPSQGLNLQTSVVTTYYALPPNETATLTPLVDDLSPGVYMIPTASITIDPASITYVDYPQFRLMSFSSTIVIPDEAVLKMFKPNFNGIQARYGFTVTTATDTENMVANFLIYPAGSPELQWKSPNIALENPIADAAIPASSTYDVSALLENFNDEDVKFGWFVSGGKLANRRARKTIWQTPTAGEHVVIVTARGKKSRAFNLAIAKVVIQ